MDNEATLHKRGPALPISLCSWNNFHSTWLCRHCHIAAWWRSPWWSPAGLCPRAPVWWPEPAQTPCAGLCIHCHRIYRNSGRSVNQSLHVLHISVHILCSTLIAIYIILNFSKKNILLINYEKYFINTEQ